MSRINTNVNSLIAQRNLTQQNNSLSKSLERLSTGLAINRGSDNPAGLIASENLRSEKVRIDAALGNATRADQVLNIADGGLQEINSLLLEVQSLVGASANDAGLSAEEKEANQQQVDAILQTIDRLASTTSFQGAKLLNGTFDFKVDAVDGNVSDFEINAAKVNTGQTQDVKVVVTQSAQHAGLVLSNAGASLGLGDDADARFTFELAGALGSKEFSFASGAAVTDIATTINSFKSVTGLSATVSNTSQLVLKSTEFGSDEFVSAKVTGGASDVEGSGIYALDSGDENAIGSQLSTFANATNTIRDDGLDIGATINGVTARGKGLTASVNTDILDIAITLDTAAGGAQTIGSVNALTISGGGATFNIGPSVDFGNQIRIGLENVAARNLGSTTDGFLDDLGSGKANNVIDGDLTAGQKIVDAAIQKISSLRGRLGAFQTNVLGSTINALGVALENTSAAESAIRDTDFAAQTADLTRSQILANAATNALSIANSTPQGVLGLL